MGYSSVKIIILLCIIQFIVWSSDLRIKQFRTYDEAIGTEFYALDFIGMANAQGYEAEWHNVTTDDGYILTLFRILPSPPFRNITEKTPVIYMAHGLGATADIFILFGRGRSIAYAFADAGYDVWIGNFRGNSYSRRHQTLSPDDEEFWNFSMDEYALTDLPVFLDYVFTATKKSSIKFLGHSLGTTTGLMLLSAKPEYNAKLDTLILLAPVSYWTTHNPARTFISTLTNSLKMIFPKGAYEFHPQAVIIPGIIKHFCTINSFTKDLCYIPYDLILGPSRQFKVENQPEFFCYYPAGISAKVSYHYVQHLNTGKFQRYKHETKDLNLRIYGSEEPPEYNVTNIVTPTIIFHAPNDPLSTADDVEALISKLPSGTLMVYERVDNEEFNHGDFVLANNADELVYSKLLGILSQSQFRR
ncbi:lipase 3-like [Fopius arisanus]|uniref:Lipase n=1 Tax=Fopius arisanus TaxID=64838 RepID=A0A9R1TAP4_9HYME|nr:PREDICTED: lipase 3-like [Fopius arisanus]